MKHEIPRFKFLPRSSKKQMGCIMLQGKVVHEIGNMEVFYNSFGYTREMAMKGILPDEFIWEEYIKDAPKQYTACYQMHILRYLKKHSVEFCVFYGDQFDKWMAAHVEAATENGSLCFACKTKTFCSAS